MNRYVRGALEWAVGYEGSTRSAAILRIFMVVLLWARHTKHHLFYEAVEDPVHAAFTVIFFLGAALVLIGLFTRVSLPVTTLGLLFWHFYSIKTLGYSLGSTEYIDYVFVGLSLTDCGRSFSVDRYLAVRRARQRGEPPPPERGAVWGLRIVCWHACMMYFWGAYNKTDLQWVRGERMERYFMHYYGTSDYPAWLGFPWLMRAGALTVLVLEYSLAFGLWFRAARRYLILPGVLMHFGMYWFLPAYHISWLMVLMYLAFIPVDDVHRFLDDQLGSGQVSLEGTGS